jgi:hypothetical protein
MSYLIKFIELQMGKYSIGELLVECLALFGIVVKAKYDITFRFHLICTIELANEKYNVGLSFQDIY